MKLYFYLLFFLFFTPLSALSTQDSLLHLLDQNPQDTLRIQLYLQLGDAVEDNNQKLTYYGEALNLAQKTPEYIDYKPFLKLAVVKTNLRQKDSVSYLYDSALCYAGQAQDSLALAQIYHSYGVHMRFLADPDLAMEYTHRSSLMYQALRDSFNYFRLLNNEAVMSSGVGDVASAKNFYDEILTKAKIPRDSWVIAAANLGIAAISKGEGNYEDAIQQNLQAYNLWKELSDTANYCKALNNLALMYMSVSMPTLALDLFQEIIETNPRNDVYGVPLALANMASILGEKEEFQKANAAMDSALVKIEKTGNLYYKTVFTLIKAEILMQAKQYAQAEPYLLEALTQTKAHQFNEDYITALILSSEMQYFTGNYLEALNQGREALVYAKKTNLLENRQKSNALVGKSLFELNKRSEAASYLLRAIELNDSLLKEEESDKLKESAITYELGKKQAVNESLRTEAELNKTILEKTQDVLKLQRLYLLIVVLFLLFALVVLWVLHRNNQIRRKMNANLQGLNKELDSKNTALHELVAVNNKIFSIISHDLRSPLVAMHSSIMLLKNPDMPTEKKDKVLAMAEGQVDSTLDLFENLLRWSKTHKDGIALNVTRVQLSDIIQKNVELVQTLLHNKDLSLEVDCSSNIEANTDSDVLHLVLRNLLSNAIKFTPRQGRITIAVEQAGAQLILRVSDSGIGITEEQIAAIFHSDEFISNNGTENEKGSGLGLKICMSFIKQLGGELLVSGIPNEGSIFTIKLPTNI